jgi:CBS domain-containing protein
MKITVAEILEAKGRSVWTVSPRTSVYDALKLMADKNIGAVAVLEGERLSGIFSERDYARKIILMGKSSKDTPVADVMTTAVVCVPPWRTIDECMAIMTARHVRHLPVLDEGKLAGLVSIGDVVKVIISEQTYAIQELEAFVDDVLKGRPKGRMSKS